MKLIFCEMLSLFTDLKFLLSNIQILKLNSDILLIFEYRIFSPIHYNDYIFLPDTRVGVSQPADHVT